MAFDPVTFGFSVVGSCGGLWGILKLFKKPCPICREKFTDINKRVDKMCEDHKDDTGKFEQYIAKIEVLVEQSRQIDRQLVLIRTELSEMKNADTALNNRMFELLRSIEFSKK